MLVRKEKLMDLPYIFETFKKLETVHEKVEYLKDLQKLKLGFYINYEALIAAWEARA
jgi:hypothetical protein